MAALATPAATVRFDRYLLGPGADAFLVGPGATMLVTAVLLTLQGLGSSAGAVAEALALWLAWIFVGPHYAATYRRAYGSRQVLRAHPWVTIVAPPLLLAAALAAVRYPRSLGLAYFAAYVVWSGYHYSGQSLGLAMLYPLRQGTRLDATETRLVAAPLYVSWIVSLLGLFRLSGPGRNPAYDAVRDAYLGPPLPSWVLLVGLTVLAASVTGVVRVARRRRRRGLPLPWPTYAVLSAQMLWFTIGLYQPFFGIRLVPVFHALQYLTFAGWHARRGGRPGRAWRPVFYAVPTVLLGLVIYPGSFWFARGGEPHTDFVVSAAIASCLNLHHFLLDGRIWRMRERPVEHSMMV